MPAKFIAAQLVCRCVYDFSREVFGANLRELQKQRFDSNLESIALARMYLPKKPLTAAEVARMSPARQRVLYELLAQYIQFFTMSPDLKFPEDFLAGCSQQQLGSNLLEYIGDHGWPYPKLLPDY